MLRKVFVVVFVVSLLSSVAAPAAPLGAPSAGLNAGQFRVGADYGYMEADIDTELTEVDGFKSNVILANIGYGVAKNFEFYGLIGGADGKVDSASGDFNSDMKAAYGFGFKATVAEGENVKWGYVYQMLWLNQEEKISGINVEIDAYEMKVAWGPSVNANGIHFFGGPLMYYIGGDIESSIDGLSADADIDQGIQFGGYLGAGINLSESITLSGEYQYTHDVETVGASLCLKF